MANDRVAQLPVEVLETSTDLKGRVAQVAVEVLVTSTSLKGSAAQAPVEVLVAPSDADYSATQVVAEVVAQDQDPAVSATQTVIEVVHRPFYTKSLTGSISPSGGLTAGTRKQTAGSLGFSAELGIDAISDNPKFDASVSPDGSLGWTAQRELDGSGASLGLSATLTTRRVPIFTASTSPAGEISRATHRPLPATLSFSPELLVRRPVNQSLTFDYLTYNAAGSQVTLDYAMIETVGLDLEADYMIAPVAGVLLQLDYRIAATSVGSDLDLDYRILENVGKDLTLDYANQGSTIAGKSLTLDYEIDAVRPVVIRYDGIDITADLIYRECEFTSLTNGSVGTGSVLIRDRLFEHGFVVGKSLELYVLGSLKWAGYVMKVKREYPFSYEDLQANVQKLPRYIRLEAVDINILFERRFTRHETTPERLKGPTFKDDYTPDTLAISRLVNNWLDLADDNIDTTSRVENVGYINVDQPAYPFQAGEKWKDAMISIASLPAAVFYLSPDRKLVYTDVDTVTNPLVLSDMPATVAGGMGVGYRQGRVQNKGDKLCNDYLAWGAQQNPVVFKREQSASSISVHGRWQDAVVNRGIHKQATLNRVAEAFVHGSPQSRRGRKNDRNSFTCTTFDSRFSVAEKVRVISNVHDFDDVLPIRMMRIRFPTPDAPQFDLTLSHEIDVFSLFDIVRYGRGRPDRLPPPEEPELPPEPPEDPIYPTCRKLDTFSRFLNYTWDPDSPYPTTQGWGTGEELTWTVNGIQFRVDGRGIIDAKMPEWPEWRSFGGPTLEAEATVPADVVPNNIVFSMSLERLDRLWPYGGVGATGEETPLMGGPNWQNPQYAADWDPNFYTGFPGPDDGHWKTTAYVGASVRDASDDAEFWMGPINLGLPPGYGVTKTIMRGSRPNVNSDQWHNNPGGFLPGVSTYAGGSSVLYGYSELNWYFSALGPGLVYRPRLSVSDLLYAINDGPAFQFNQQVLVRFFLGSHQLRLYKEQTPFIQYFNNNPSGNAFVLDTTAGVAGPYDMPMAKWIEPGFNYFIRWWRPNNNNTYIKFWESWGEEPADWQAFYGDQPPYAWDIVNQEWVEWPFGKPTDESLGSNRRIAIDAKVQPMQQYAVAIDGIWACEDTSDIEQIPFPTAGTGSGGAWTTETYVGTPADGFMHTYYNYQPGTLIVRINGVTQRSGVDFAETTPSAGLFQLLYAPNEFGASSTDTITVEYVVA